VAELSWTTGGRRVTGSGEKRDRKTPGAGLLIATHAISKKGILKRGVLPKKAPIVTFRPIAQKSCRSTCVGVIGVLTPPVTG
jgi:hypothetical protein